MARYLGPKCRLQRRERVELGLKTRAANSKCNMETTPGQHGANPKQPVKYGAQVREKQKMKRYYQILERQFRNHYRLAANQKGSTGLNLLLILERRLDNVVYRLGFGATRSEARQLVSHKAVMVNGETVNIPSFLVKVGDIIEIREKAKSQIRITEALAEAAKRDTCDWLELIDSQNKVGQFKRLPDRQELPSILNEQSVVELYSK